jgi:antitoxin (DNA-binding transcriptional repressor) of toxin-antitoxin stability system
MRSITETQATREFVSVLREVANGETVLITKDDGAPFARIEPDHKTVVERLAELRRKFPPDPEFGEHLERTVRELRESAGGVREHLWHDR